MGQYKKTCVRGCNGLGWNCKTVDHAWGPGFAVCGPGDDGNGSRFRKGAMPRTQVNAWSQSTDVQDGRSAGQQARLALVLLVHAFVLPVCTCLPY